MHSNIDVSFHHPRHPHTWQLYLATTAAVLYLLAIPGLISIHNPLGAAGWSCAFVLASCWALLLRQENQWRKLEQLEVQNPTDDGATQLPPITQNRAHTQPLVYNTTFRNQFPWYLTQCAFIAVITCCFLLLGASIFFFTISGIDSEPLNGSSHWLAGISFFAAAKSSTSLAIRMKRVRNTYMSVMTYLRESYTPLP